MTRAEFLEHNCENDDSAGDNVLHEARHLKDRKSVRQNRQNDGSD